MRSQYFVGNSKQVIVRGVALLTETPNINSVASSPSTPKPKPPPVIDKRGRMILISDIPPEETVESMTQYFSSFGTIETTTFYRHSKTAGSWHMSVTFSTSESASQAAGFRHKKVTVRLEGSRPTPSTPLRRLPEVTIDPEEGDSFEACLEHAFEDYNPVHFRDGFRHPGRLVESSSLSSVDPPPITYQLALPRNVSDHTSPFICLTPPPVAAALFR
jgi:hypothetical protein